MLNLIVLILYRNKILTVIFNIQKFTLSEVNTSYKPIKKGKIGTTSIGSKVLINDLGTPYNIEPGIIEIWESLDGQRTIEEIALYYSKLSNCDPKTIEKDLITIFLKMMGVGLID